MLFSTGAPKDRVVFVFERESARRLHLRADFRRVYLVNVTECSCTVMVAVCARASFTAGDRSASVAAPDNCGGCGRESFQITMSMRRILSVEMRTSGTSPSRPGRADLQYPAARARENDTAPICSAPIRSRAASR